EGSYAGKGIYDLDAFEAALAGRVPDSMVLSHDLFEGVFARAGLASDVEVVEEFPARYDVAALRHHRWARGDWQLLPWIFGRWPSVGGHQTQLAMPAIGRWKMLDNLRRTVSAPAAILAFLAGWTLPIDAAAGRDYRAQLPWRNRPRSPPRFRSIRARGDVSGAPGVVDGRCNRPNHDPVIHHSTASPRMDLGSPGNFWSATRCSRLLSPDGRCCCYWVSRG